MFLANGERHSEPAHERGPSVQSTVIEGGNSDNGEVSEDDEDEEDEEDARFLQELRERREVTLQVVVEVYTEVHNTT